MMWSLSASVLFALVSGSTNPSSGLACEAAGVCGRLAVGLMKDGAELEGSRCAFLGVCCLHVLCMGCAPSPGSRGKRSQAVGASSGAVVLSSA